MGWLWKVIFVKRRPVGQSHIQLPGVNCSAFQPMATSNREKKHPANFYDGNSYVGCIRTVFVHKLNRHTFKKKKTCIYIRHTNCMASVMRKSS